MPAKPIVTDMERAIRKISILILIVALAQSATAILASESPDILKEIGQQVKNDISNDIRYRSRQAVRNATDKARQKMTSGVSNAHRGPKKTVKIEKFPESVAEFQALWEEKGITPEGTVALQVIALGMCSEIDLETGLQCMEMISTPTGLTSHAKDRLREWYAAGTNNPRPYQAASFMKGAKPDNGYNPKRPLSMVMRIVETKELEDGDLVTVRLEYSGSESSKDIKITVKRPDDDEYYYIHANGSMYTKVRKKKRDTTYNGLR